MCQTQYMYMYVYVYVYVYVHVCICICLPIYSWIFTGQCDLYIYIHIMEENGTPDIHGIYSGELRIILGRNKNLI